MSSFLWPHGLQHIGLPCPSQLLELAQTRVHWVSDAIQPSHPLSSPSPPTFNLSHHQGLFQWVSSSPQESSTTPQFKSINSLVLSFLYGSILTSHMWYLYTVAYYFAIKRNAFDSVLMRWMNLEPTIQSEVSQKNKHHILMHIYGIQKDGTDRPIHSPSWLKIWYIGSCWWVVYAWWSVYSQLFISMDLWIQPILN